MDERDEGRPAADIDQGRLMALDLGEKRIGVALSDETRLIARSHAVIERTSRAADFAQIGRIVARESVTEIVVGLPVELDGNEGPLAQWVRDYARALGQHLEREIHFWDESFTSKQASESMRARGIKAREQKEWIDAVAAAFILQDYLDASRRA